MTDLADFLLARIAEDEQAVRDFLSEFEGSGSPLHRPEITDVEKLKVAQDEDGLSWWGEYAHLSIAPARVLAECEAKRRIVAALDMTPCPCHCAERCVIHDASAGGAAERYVDPVTNTVLRESVAVYADHPDYRQEWKP